MKLVPILLLAVIVIYVGYEGVRMYRLYKVSEQLIATTKPFTRAEGTKSMLVLGDSTAVGLGTSNPSYSVAGRLSQRYDASVENYAKSGAVTADLSAQLSRATRSHYDLILIQIGANDVIRLHSLDAAKTDLSQVLASTSKLSSHVVLLTAGKIGNAKFFPKLLATPLNNRTAHLRSLFMATAQQYGAGYVDLFTAPDPFSADPKRYYAGDGLHLTDAGYGFWFDEVVKVIDAKWPELNHGH